MEIKILENSLTHISLIYLKKRPTKSAIHTFSIVIRNNKSQKKNFKAVSHPLSKGLKASKREQNKAYTFLKPSAFPTKLYVCISNFQYSNTS